MKQPNFAAMSPVVAKAIEQMMAEQGDKFSLEKVNVEFFPNAKQENLFIGILHGFRYMGVPQYILTDNMKSVVIRRDQDGHPLWQKDYEQFMRTVGFQTKLCKPRHPFTKGKVERLVRFVKDNFLAGRSFWYVTDLNLSALDWCDEQNTTFHRGLGIPQDIHRERCGSVVAKLNDSPERQMCTRSIEKGRKNTKNRRSPHKNLYGEENNRQKAALSIG